MSKLISGLFSEPTQITRRLAEKTAALILPSKIAYVVALILSALSAARLDAQLASSQTAGISAFESYQHTDIDSVNLANGNLYVHIPLVSFPQLGDKLNLNYIVRFNAPEWTTTVTASMIPEYYSEQTYEAEWFLSNPYFTDPRPVGVDVVRDQAMTAVTSTITYMCVAPDLTGPGDCQTGTALWNPRPTAARSSLGVPRLQQCLQVCAIVRERNT
jgi:hypothetical protein